MQFLELLIEEPFEIFGYREISLDFLVRVEPFVAGRGANFSQNSTMRE